MKKFFTVAIALIGCSVAICGQSAGDPTIMRINGKDILRSEFEYSYNKNNSDGVIEKKTVEEYVPLYVDFKLKVAEAESAGIDTLARVRKELNGYKEQMVIPYIVDLAYIEREARKTYDATAARFAGEDVLTAAHILVLLRQDAASEDAVRAKARIDSIYAVLKDVPATELESRFADVARECSDDKGSALRGGDLGQFGRGMMIPDFENAAYALKKGEMSAPVQSTVGYHIIYMKDRHPFEPYEYHHDAIINFLEGRGIKEASANAYVDSIAKLEGVERDVVIERLFAKLAAEDPDMKNLSLEYYDGTLMYEISKSAVWDKAQSDEQGLSEYFNAHKKDYTWDKPRYSGIIIRGKDESVVEQAKKLVKKVNEPDWAETIVSALNSDSVKVVRVERGLFKQGDNAVIDSLVYGDKSKTIKPLRSLPATGVYGNKIKKPRNYKDVKGQVTADYQNEMERRWIEDLRRKYEVVVYEDVVKTVKAKN